MKGFYYLILFVSVPLSLLAEERIGSSVGDTIAVDVDSNAITLMSTNSTNSSKRGGVYDPIKPDNVPPTMIPSAICYQETQIVGTQSGCKVIHQVISGRCESGFDGSCNLEACVTSVGDTFTAIDPACLIGM